MSEEFPFMEPGDEITVDLVNGGGIAGTLKRLQLEDQYRLAYIVIRPADFPPEHGDLTVIGSQIRAWRTGGPIIEKPQRQPDGLMVGIPMPGTPFPGRGRG